MAWERVSVHEVVSEFVRAEPHRVRTAIDPTELTPALWAIINGTNLSDPAENQVRLRVLYVIRRWIIGDIPPDTEWYKVSHLTDAELDELHVIARCGKDDPNGSDRNELRKVAVRLPQTLTKPPTAWERPILWGHDRAGPFTIIEGNTRLTAYVCTNPAPGLSIPVLVGLSPTPCMWHIHDPGTVIANDLWKG